MFPAAPDRISARSALSWRAADPLDANRFFSCNRNVFFNRDDQTIPYQTRFNSNLVGGEHRPQNVLRASQDFAEHPIFVG